MLYSSKHAGVELCLGPFKDQEDREKKVKNDLEEERKKEKADVEGLIRRNKQSQYWLNKALLESKSRACKSNLDDTEE